MNFHVEIPDEEMENMSEDAKNELHEQLNIYVKSVIREVCLIEEGSREEGANREITSSMIKLAVKKYKSNKPKKNGMGLIILKLVSWFSLLITGFLFDSNGYQNHFFKLILFVFMLILACVSTVLQLVKEE